MSLNEYVAIFLTVAASLLLCTCLSFALKPPPPLENNVVVLENKPSQPTLVFGFILTFFGIYVLVNGLPVIPNSRSWMGLFLFLWGFVIVWEQLPKFLKQRDLRWNESFVEGPNKNFSLKFSISRTKIDWVEVEDLGVTKFTHRLFLKSSSGEKIYFEMNYKDDGSFEEKI